MIHIIRQHTTGSPVGFGEVSDSGRGNWQRKQGHLTHTLAFTAGLVRLKPQPAARNLRATFSPALLSSCCSCHSAIL